MGPELFPPRILAAALLLVFSQEWCGAASPAWLTSHDAEIHVLVAKMTLAEKAGQMTQPDIKAIKDPADIATLALGSVLSGGSSDPKTGNGMQDWADLYESCQRQALRSRLGIPLLYGIDAVHGDNNVVGAVIFPHNVGMGCTRNADLVAKATRITAEELRATGIQWSFAPCVAVPQDIRWGRTYEGFSEDPAVVAKLGLAAVRGLQGADLSGPAAALACAKHFIADGGTAFNSSSGKGLLDQGDARMDEAALRSTHLAGFTAAIDAGVGSIMPSYSSWNGVKCSGSKRLLTDLLKKELGFQGFLISDYNAINQLAAPAKDRAEMASGNASGQVVTGDYKKCIEISINAGMDMVMVTTKYHDFITQLQELVNEGKIPMSRIDDAVTRILRAKFALGMMRDQARLMPDKGLQREFGSTAHREVAREAVRESLVILKNERHVLPLAKGARRIHVTGSGADDLGMQCGGWTVDWQGKRGEVTTGGTTILAAMRAAAGKDTEITSSKSGRDASGADVALVVIGESPYAEMKGDRADLSLTPEDTAAVSDAKSTGVPVVVVVLSGRPVVLGQVASQADAIVAAWWPGTEGGGVADVLTGSAKPVGKLSYAWPASMEQVPKASGGEKPLFPLGFGLSY